MRCLHCRTGRAFRDYFGDWACLNCAHPAFLALPTLPSRHPSPALDPLRQRARRHTVTPAGVAAIRLRLKGAAWGTRTAIARDIAAETGLSTFYVQQLARGHHRAAGKE